MFDVDWQHFTPWTALAGGALIGLSAGALGLLGGKIAGISGILGATLDELRRGVRPTPWRAAFLGGIVLASLAWAAFAPVPGAHHGSHGALIAVAGVLVGFGTRLGSGCASGHGVCGLSRLSLRSAVAVATFMACAMFTATLLRLH